MNPVKILVMSAIVCCAICGGARAAEVASAAWVDQKIDAINATVAQKMDAKVTDDSTSGSVVTGVSVSANDGITVTRSNVRVPVGAADATEYVDIWFD